MLQRVGKKTLHVSLPVAEMRDRERETEGHREIKRDRQTDIERARVLGHIPCVQYCSP